MYNLKFNYQNNNDRVNKLDVYERTMGGISDNV